MAYNTIAGTFMKCYDFGLKKKDVHDAIFNIHSHDCWFNSSNKCNGHKLKLHVLVYWLRRRKKQYNKMTDRRKVVGNSV